MEQLLFLALVALGGYHLSFRMNLPRVRTHHRREARMRDAVDQLRDVMAASFRPKKLMSKDEYRVFKVIEEEVGARHAGHRVFAQTSLAEMIGSDDDLAFKAINGKRVDIMILGPFGDPVSAIEYQGGKHYQGNAAARDAVKKEALRKAGVTYIEIDETHTDEDIRRLVSGVVPQVR